MAVLFCDTHALVWYLARPERLSPRSLIAFERAEAEGNPIYTSAISLVEICYLVEKGKLSEQDLALVLSAIDDPEFNLHIVPLDRFAALAIRSIPRDLVPDMPDRIIAATARMMELPLVTRDGEIQDCGIDVVW